MTPNPYDITGLAGDEPVAPDAGAEAPPAKAPPRGDRGATKSYTAQMARANVLLVLLFIIGGAGVYALSLGKGPAKASAEQQLAEAQVESAILRLGEMSPGVGGKPGGGHFTKALLQAFYVQVTERQVPLKGLKKDPFVFVPPAAPESLAVDKPAAEPAADPTQEDSQAEALGDATARFNRLHLQSIMKGRLGGGTAVISNNLVTVGQKVEGFVVKSITPKTVVLTWREKEFRLEMP